MGLSRTFKVSLLLSTLIHMGAFMVVNQEKVAQTILSPPAVILAKKNEPKAVRFELVETPSSAETSKPPEKTNLMSDKNTRAQDRFGSEEKLKDSPHMEGKHEESKDTRPRVIPAEPPKPVAEPAPRKAENAPRPKAPAPEKTEKPEPREEKKEAVPKSPVEPERMPTEPAEEKVVTAAEPKEKEIIQLAKEMPAAEPSVSGPPPAQPRVISVASSKNTGADAQITGELSFGATRHFFGEYLLKMKQAVERQWVSRLVSKYTGIVSSKAVIDFKIQPDGQVTDLVVNSSEGDPYFPLVCVSSITDAQPFGDIPYEEVPALPEEFIGKPLNIRFTFQYD